MVHPQLSFFQSLFPVTCLQKAAHFPGCFVISTPVLHRRSDPPRPLHSLLTFVTAGSIIWLAVIHSSFFILFLFSFSFFPYFLNPVMSMWCSLSMLHPVRILLHIQFHCLSFFLLSTLYHFLSSLLLTLQIQPFQRCVYFQHFTHRFCPFRSNPIACHLFFLIYSFSFFHTVQNQCRQCGVHFQHFTQRFCSFISNPIPFHSLFFPFFSFSFLFSHHSDAMSSMLCSL